ncbi:MAG: alpha/beta hydrolase family protein [Sandaracinaceae bacterium]
MRWLDELYVGLRPRRGVFEDGWGDEAELTHGLDPGLREVAPPPVAIRWTRARAHAHARLREGELISPDRGLPAESRLARVLLVEPREGDARGLVVALSSWGEEDFEGRRQMLAAATRAGVAALILETPFYGARRRVGQDGPRLRYVSDFVTGGRATVLEARALMGWARERYPRVGVTGYSMGAQVAAMSAVLVPWPVHVVIAACALSPARVFFDGPLRADVERAPLGPGGHARLRDAMESLSILDLPPPHDPSRARILGTRADAIVSPGDSGAIARHWGTSVRWLDDGHVSALLWRGHAIGQAVVDAFA